MTVSLHPSPSHFPADKNRNPLAGIAITVDGPTASGKGTLAKALARRWRLKFLDTGAVYRAVAYSVLKNGGDPADTKVALAAAQGLQFDFRHKGNNEFGVWVDGVEVSDELRTLEVGQAASIVAVQPAVRAALLEFQVEFGKRWKELVGVVLDGRDTGARICPQAEVKLFLTADVAERARRRWLEQQAKGGNVPVEAVEAQIAARDARDRDNTIVCEDAVVIDGSKLDAAGVLRAAIQAVEAKVGAIAAVRDEA